MSRPAPRRVSWLDETDDQTTPITPPAPHVPPTPPAPPAITPAAPVPVPDVAVEPPTWPLPPAAPAPAPVPRPRRTPSRAVRSRQAPPPAAALPRWSPPHGAPIPVRRGAAHRAREGLMTVSVFVVATATAALIIAVGLVTSAAIG